MNTKTILLVEDNEDDIFIMRRSIKQADIQCPLHIVQDGEAAVEYMRGQGAYRDREQHPIPCLVFLDLKLPLRSGHEVLEWIRGEEQFDAVVVVVLTSSEQPEDVRRAYHSGANSYLVKPPTAIELLEMSKAIRTYWLERNRFDPSLS